jgi:hypothetical protein
MNSRISLIQINKGGRSIWQIRPSLVRIATMNSFSMKANRPSTRKRGSKTNRKGALTAEPQKSSKWEIGGVAATAVEEIEAVTEVLVVTVAGGKLKGE